MLTRILLLLVASLALRADDRTMRLVARLSQEAEAFQKIAPELVGQETLFQRALKPPSKLRRWVTKPEKAPELVWQERRIVSEYGFSTLSHGEGPLHELRQVISVDGRNVQDSKKAADQLAKAITAHDDTRKKQMLEQFEKYGLIGAVTDFGQLILLFNPRDIERYEFTFRRHELQGAAHLLVFGYKQIDGPEALTVIDAQHKDQIKRMRIEGEVWTREDTLAPVRITMVASEGDGEAEPEVRQEATVDYAISPEGWLLPSSTEHRERRDGNVVVENKFSYSDFHRFTGK